ncbi:DUF721 domain-containing protein [Flavimaricola marinus]|uniref:Zn-ribbon-containing, possibly RNA-binding protein and truncated derivatives n=1 Tax=Flavimaricola marinus TaxID=1819565 RepID=A0A238LFG0_9RHOB|nr:DUF721 domain-containing protein [Flavimaricola marinus]SMY08313.1 hypothetical protein LOM8899_02464 [Flavimaricola marinus]
MKTPRKQTSTYGFAAASKLVQSRIRTASETRGFAETRLLTHWEEIVGPSVAQIARPVKIGYGREGFGATLTVLTTGAQAPMLEMQKDQIRDKVNACYGYRAISRVRVTQTAPTGFSDGQVAFGHKAKATPAPPSPELTAAATAVVGPVKNDELRLALEALATNVLRKQSS